MAFSSPDLRLRTHIIIECRPSLHTGLLLYTAQYRDEGAGDFLGISLYDGFVEARMVLGAGLHTARTANRVIMGKYECFII